jgi:histidine triad (HIT) family protein
MASIFTRIINREIPSYAIAETDRFYAFLDIFPLREGHTLVVPKQETDHFFDLDESQLAGLMAFARPIAKAIERAFPCNRCGMAVVGLEVPHAHLHLVPIDGADDLNFTRPKLTLSPGELAECQRRILEQLKG